MAKRSKDSIDSGDVRNLAAVYHMFLKSFYEYIDQNDLAITDNKKQEIAAIQENLKQYMEKDIKDQSIANITNGPFFSVFAEDIKKYNQDNMTIRS